MSTVKADYLVNAAGTGAPTLTNGIVLPAGSASAPAISPTGDSNTGIFFPAADTVAVTTGGTERMRVDSSGKVGIGTTSPNGLLEIASTAPNIYLKETEQAADEKLWKFALNSKTFSLQTATDANGFGASSIVIGRGTGTAIDYQAFRTGANVERMRIDASGNVGIGTTSPSALLEVRNGSNTGGSGTWLTKVHQNTNAVGANGLSVMNSWAGSTSKVLELAVAWNGTTAAYYPIFQIDGINQRFSAIYGSGGSAAVATVYPEFQCRAWVKFGGTGTIAGSGNVSSVTNPSTGRYVVSFTTAMPDANYAVSTGGTVVDSTGNPWQAWGNISRGYGTGSFTIDCSAQGTTGAGQANWAIVTVAVFR